MPQRSLGHPEKSLSGDRTPSVNDQLTVRILQDPKPRQWLRRRARQHATAGIEFAAMAGALKSPFHLRHCTSKVRAYGRHCHYPFFRGCDEQTAFREKCLAPRGESLRPADFEHSRRAKNQVGNEKPEGANPQKSCGESGTSPGQPCKKLLPG